MRRWYKHQCYRCNPHVQMNAEDYPTPDIIAGVKRCRPTIGLCRAKKSIKPPNGPLWNSMCALWKREFVKTNNMVRELVNRTLPLWRGLVNEGEKKILETTVLLVENSQRISVGCGLRINRKGPVSNWIVLNDMRVCLCVSGFDCVCMLVCDCVCLWVFDCVCVCVCVCMCVKF